MKREVRGIWARFLPGKKPGFAGLRYRSGPGADTVARFAPPPIPRAMTAGRPAVVNFFFKVSAQKFLPG
jgi:hypothetical protein